MVDRFRESRLTEIGKRQAVEESRVLLNVGFVKLAYQPVVPDLRQQQRASLVSDSQGLLARKQRQSAFVHNFTGITILAFRIPFKNWPKSSSKCIDKSSPIALGKFLGQGLL
jgi:hypothetical protein